MDLVMAPRSLEAAAEEVVMISQSCDFDEFLERVRDRNYLEVIYLAYKEATEAERLRYRSGIRRPDPPGVCAGYADALKGFIRFMRYGVKSPSIEDNLHAGLQAFRAAVLENYNESAEVVEGSGGKEQVDAEIRFREKAGVTRWRLLARYPYRFLWIPDGMRDRQRRYGRPAMKLFCVSSPQWSLD